MPAVRCRAPQCGRFVRACADHCARHDAGTEGSRDALEVDTAHLEFLERLEQGNYEGLLDAQVREVMIQAAAALREQGLSDEIGALRYVLARLLKEEKDLTRLTANVVRIASAAVQTARAQRAIGGDTAEGLTSAVTQILAELDEG